MDTCLQHDWNSDDWQNHVNAILHQHFSILGHTYQRVADAVLGDGGLEGFSSNGCAFQIYADQNSNSKQERLVKLKDKITADLPKLKKYEKEWAARLGDLKLKEWTLVVPLYEDKARRCLWLRNDAPLALGVTAVNRLAPLIRHTVKTCIKDSK